MRWVWAKLYKKVKCIFSEFSLATFHGEGGLIEMGLLLQVHTDMRHEDLRPKGTSRGRGLGKDSRGSQLNHPKGGGLLCSPPPLDFSHVHSEPQEMARRGSDQSWGQDPDGLRAQSLMGP